MLLKLMLMELERGSASRCHSTSVGGWWEGALKNLGGARRDGEGEPLVTQRARRSSGRTLSLSSLLEGVRALADVLLDNPVLTRFWSLTPDQCFPTPCAQSSS